MKKGLAVGISDYMFGQLEGCSADAYDFANLMKWNGDSGNGEENFQMEYKKDLNRADLKKAIKEHFAKEADVLLFYFSGHGELSETGGNLLTADSDLEEIDSGVSMDFLLAYANTSGARNRIILLDCCHAGAIGGGKYTAGISPGVTIITSCADSQVSFQINGKGAFTSFLLQALRGSAADLSGNITPGSIYTYVDKMMGLADEQRPVFKTNVSSFIILRKTDPAIPWSVLRNIITYFPEPDHEYKLDPSYEFMNKEGSEFSRPPYARDENIKIFKELQKMQGIGLVVPVKAEFMYFAAMKSKWCALTDLGKQYWAIVKRKEQ